MFPNQNRNEIKDNNNNNSDNTNNNGCTYLLHRSPIFDLQPFSINILKNIESDDNDDEDKILNKNDAKKTSRAVSMMDNRKSNKFSNNNNMLLKNEYYDTNSIKNPNYSSHTKVIGINTMRISHQKYQYHKHNYQQNRQHLQQQYESQPQKQQQKLININNYYSEPVKNHENIFDKNGSNNNNQDINEYIDHKIDENIDYNNFDDKMHTKKYTKKIILKKGIPKPKLGHLNSQDELSEFSEQNAIAYSNNSSNIPGITVKSNSNDSNELSNNQQGSLRALPLSSPSRKTMNFIQQYLKNTNVLSDDATKNQKPIIDSDIYASNNHISFSNCLKIQGMQSTEIIDFTLHYNNPIKSVSPPVEQTRRILRDYEFDKKKYDRNKKKMSLIIKRGLDDIRIITKITQYLSLSGSVAFMKSYGIFNSNKHIRRIFANHIFDTLKNFVEDEDAYYYFKFLINFPKIMKLHPNSYHKKSIQPSLYERDINSDIDRTFSENGYFETLSGRDSLKKVLTAISNTRKDVGYIQGLNCIVGTLLLHFSEEESFWALLYFMEKLDVKNLFNQDFENVNLLNYQLHYFTEFYFPEISNYLKERNMEVGYFSTAWFITLFSSIFSHKFVVKCWCAFILKGYPFLIRLALAIFGMHKDDIILRECDEAGDFLKNALKTTEPKILDMCLKFKVTKRLLNGLKRFYHSPGKSQLKLTPIGKKLEWMEYNKFDNSKPNESIKSTAFTLNQISNLPSASFINNEMNVHQNAHLNIDFNTPSPVASIHDTKLETTSPRFLHSIVNTFKVDFAGRFKNLFGKDSSSSSLIKTSKSHFVKPIFQISFFLILKAGKDGNNNSNQNLKENPSNQIENYEIAPMNSNDTNDPYSACNSVHSPLINSIKSDMRKLSPQNHNKLPTIYDSIKFDECATYIKKVQSSGRIMIKREENPKKIILDKTREFDDEYLTCTGGDFEDVKKKLCFDSNLDGIKYKREINHNNISDSVLSSSQISITSQIDENIKTNLGKNVYMSFVNQSEANKVKKFDKTSKLNTLNHEHLNNDKDETYDFETYMNAEWTANRPNQL